MQLNIIIIDKKSVKVRWNQEISKGRNIKWCTLTFVVQLKFSVHALTKQLVFDRLYISITNKKKWNQEMI